MSSRGMPVTKQMKNERRQRAEKMQEEYSKLTLEQKLAKLPPPPGAAKQRARLEAMLTQPKAQVAASSSVTDEVKEKSKVKKSKSKIKE